MAKGTINLPEGFVLDKELTDMPKGFIIDEGILPEELSDNENRARNSIYYSQQFGIEPNQAYVLEPNLNEAVFGKREVDNPGRLFFESFLQSLADKPAMMLKGVEVYTPGRALGIDTLLDKSSVFLRSLKDKETQKKLEKVASGKLWPTGEDKRWWQLDKRYVPEVINTWSVNVADQIPITLITFAGRAAGKVIGKPVGALVAAGAAVVTGGPDPSDVATAPAVSSITNEVVKHLGGAAPLVAMEAGNFMDDAEALGLDPDISEKWAKMYGLGSGTIEYAQQLWLLGRYSKIAKPVQDTILKQALSHIVGSGIEGLEELSQQGLENFLLQKAVAEMKERHPEFEGVAPSITAGIKRSGQIGAGVAFLTGLPGTGMSITKGQLARRQQVQPETKKFLGEPAISETEEVRPVVPEKPKEKEIEVPKKVEEKPKPKKLPPEEIETIEEAREAERKLEAEAAEIIEPNLHIGSVTEGMKRRIEKGTGISAEDIKGFTEKGFPTIRTKVKLQRGEAEKYLDFLEERLLNKLDKNLINTESDLAKANAEWGDIKTLRATLGLPKVKRPFTVIRAEKRKIKVIEEPKPRIAEAIRPTEESKLTVGEVLRVTLKRQARAARMAFAKGRKELRAQIRVRKRAKARIDKAIKAIKQKIPKTVDFFFREAIEALTTDIDLARRSEKTLKRRRATLDFIKRHPERTTEIPQKLMKQLGQRPLNEFTIGELEQVANEVDRLIRQGKLKRKLKQKPIIEQRKKDIAELTENTETVKPSRVKEGPNVLSITKQGFIESAFDKIKAATWTPQRLFDMLDGGKNFLGKWHQVFFDDVKKAKSKFFKRKQTRRQALTEKMKDLDISAWDLSKARQVGTIRYQVQELMGVYMASKNRLSKMVLNFGHELTDANIRDAIDVLTPQEKALADFILEDYEQNYPRLRRSVIEQENRDPGKEEFYSPIRRQDDLGKPLQQEMKDAVLRREGLRRAGVEKGFTLERKEVPPEGQTKMRLDAVNVYIDQIEKLERFIALGPQVRRMNKIIANKELRRTLKDRFGADILKTVDEYIGAVANPYIYKQFSSIERASAWLRKNTALAYLGFNLVTMGKQLPSVLLYLPDAGPSHLMASAVDFARNPLEMIEKVRGLDPELRERSIERELEELKTGTNANFIKQKIGKFGMEGIFLFDTIARTIGWNAVYEQALQDNKSEAEAINLARNATLRTQPAAAAEDIPALYRTNEFLNWFTMFTNQLNKLFNIATYDIPSYFKNEQYSKAALQAMSMSVIGVMIWSVMNRKIPEEPEEFVEAISEQAINMVPLFGKPWMAARKGWNSDIPLFKNVKGLVQATDDLEFTRRDIESIAEGVAVTTGIPFIAIRRAIQAVEEEQPTALLGARKKKKGGIKP